MKKFFVVFFIILTFSIAVFFMTQVFQAAQKKDFWTDEEMALNITLTRGYVDTLIQGAKTQGSPSPLEYLGLKVLHDLRETVHSFGLPFNVYYRLNSIFYSFLSGLLIIWMVFFRIKSKANHLGVLFLQSALLIAALSLYYFMPTNFHFSIEMRPYALWNALWLGAMVLFLFPEKKKYLIFCLSVLAMTATASIFQLFALAVSFLFLNLMERKKIINIIKEGISIFLIPTGICLYYVLGTSQTWNYGNAQRYWDEFFYFWMNSERIFLVPLLGLAFLFPIKKFQRFNAIFITMLILYFMAPLINFITIERGFFFSPRQYRYYSLVYPFF